MNILKGKMLMPVFVVDFAHMPLKIWFCLLVIDLRGTKLSCGCSFIFLEDVYILSGRLAFQPIFLNLATLADISATDL